MKCENQRINSAYFDPNLLYAIVCGEFIEFFAIIDCLLVFPHKSWIYLEKFLFGYKCRKKHEWVHDNKMKMFRVGFFA